LTSERKIRANRANARASTGPRTARGRTRAARNALRHALSLPVCSIPALSEEVQALAREIAGPGANAETQELARRVAEAQIDLRRVRYARHQFLSDTLSKKYYGSYATLRKKLKVLRALLRPIRQTCHWKPWSLRPRHRKGRTSSRRFYRERRKSYWPWIAMSGGRWRAANSRSGPSMRHELALRPRMHAELAESLRSQSSASLFDGLQWRERQANSRFGQRRSVGRRSLIVRSKYATYNCKQVAILAERSQIVPFFQWIQRRRNNFRSKKK